MNTPTSPSPSAVLDRMHLAAQCRALADGCTDADAYDRLVKAHALLCGQTPDDDDRAWAASVAPTIKAERARAAVDVEGLVKRFLSWPLPASVCSDTCVSMPGYQFPRRGTNLLSAEEARDMLKYVLADAFEALSLPKGEQSPQDRLSRDADIILQAINEYDGWMKDDNYNAQGILTKIMDRMRDRYFLVERSFPAPPEEHADPKHPVAASALAAHGDISSLIGARVSAADGPLIDCPVCGAVDTYRANVAPEALAASPRAGDDFRDELAEFLISLFWEGQPGIDRKPPSWGKRWRGNADKLIARYPALATGGAPASVPAGWKLVLVDPTMGMLRKAMNAKLRGGGIVADVIDLHDDVVAMGPVNRQRSGADLQWFSDVCRVVYCAALAASPTPEPQGTAPDHPQICSHGIRWPRNETHRRLNLNCPKCVRHEPPEPQGDEISGCAEEGERQ